MRKELAFYDVGDEMTYNAFEIKQYQLSGKITLEPLTPHQALQAGEQMARINPWSKIGIASEAIISYLDDLSPSATKLGIWYESRFAGVVCVRYPWLKGPYLELLGLFPAFQGQGIGSVVMDWFETQGRAAQSRNLWLLASDFNHAGIAFYERHGFTQITTLKDLSGEGIHDILMRKALF